MSPRRDRLALSLGRGAIWGFGAVALVLAGGMFGAGYWLGRQASARPSAAAVAEVTRPAPRGSTRVAPPPKPRAPKPEASSAAPVAAAPVVAAQTEPETPPIDVASEAPRASTATAAQASSPAPPPVDVRLEAPRRGFGLQIGAYPAEDEARAFLTRHAVALEGLPVHLVRAEVKGEVWFRIRVGRFGSRARAQRARDDLGAALAPGAIVVRYR